MVLVIGVLSLACTSSGTGRGRAPALEGRSWSLDLPEGWQLEDADEVVSVFRSAGVGALQISAFAREKPFTDEHLQELAEDDLNAGAVPEPVQLGGFTGFHVSVSRADSFWSKWFVRHGRQALLITYNCRAAERGSEYDEVKRILQTLRVVEHCERSGT